jgi:ABC-type sugar transport system substrate-binding protein
MKKPLLGLALVAVVGLAAAGCGSSGGTSGGGGGSAASPLKIGISLPALDDYYTVVEKGAQDEAKKKGVDLLTGDGNTASDPTQQIAKIQDMLAQGIKVLMVSPPSDALVPVLDRAISMNVKVMFIDQALPNWKKASTFIATDNPTGSTQIGEYLAQKLGNKGEVGIMVGVPGAPVALARYQNLQKVLQQDGIKVVLTSQADGCQIDSAVPVVKSFLTSHPELDAIYSICGPTGLAVDKVLSERKGGKKILSASWDVLVQQVSNIIAGKESVAVAQFPVKLGTTAVDDAIALHGGQTFPAYIDNGTELVTSDNAATFFHDGTTGYSYKIG